MTSAIMNPTRIAEMEAIGAANLLMNNDPNGAAWIAFSRIVEAFAAGTPFSEAAQAAAAARGTGRRRRRS
jgi:5-methyltetrahydrofolate--homocysteine methyltransferase